MQPELVNLTVPEVMQKIENVLEDYPAHPYQSAFSLPELRQKLIAHVLGLISHYYTNEELQQRVNKTQVHDSSPLRQKLQMDMIIRGGILNILRENADLLSRY